MQIWRKREGGGIQRYQTTVRPKRGYADVYPKVK